MTASTPPPTRTTTLPGQGPAPAGPEQLTLWARPGPQFPADLLPGECVTAYTGEGAQPLGDFEITSAHGHQYRITRAHVWRIARLPMAAHSSTGGYAWIGFDPTLDQLMSWLRRDAASRVLAAERWARWGHLNEDDVPFSLEPNIWELEPGVVLLERYGRRRIAADYPWGWEPRPCGRLPENPDRRSGATGRLSYTLWCLTRAGFDAVPTERLTVLRTYWRQDLDCATGGPNHLGSCKVHHPRFLVAVHDEHRARLGTVVLCARHWGNRLGGSQGYYPPPLADAAARISGRPFVDWQDRLAELTWEMTAPAVDRGLPLPDVAGALLQQALDEGEQHAAQEARRAARAAGLNKRQQDLAARSAQADRQARRAELATQALAEVKAVHRPT